MDRLLLERYWLTRRQVTLASCATADTDLVDETKSRSTAPALAGGVGDGMVVWTISRGRPATRGGGHAGHESRSNFTRTPTRAGGSPPPPRHYSPSTAPVFERRHTHNCVTGSRVFALVGLVSPR